MVFASIVWKVFLLMYLPFPRPIFGKKTYRVPSLFYFPSFSANPRRHVFCWGIRIILVHAPFSTTLFFVMRSNSENYRNGGLFSHHCSSMFMICSAPISVSVFDGKRFHNGVTNVPGIDTFRDLQMLKQYESMYGSHFYFLVRLINSYFHFTESD